MRSPLRPPRTSCFGGHLPRKRGRKTETPAHSFFPRSRGKCRARKNSGRDEGGTGTSSQKALLAFVAAVLFLAACGDNAPRSPSSAAPNDIVLNRGNGAEAESLDPALADTSWEQWIIGDLMMGLFTEDAQGNPS